MTKGGSKIIKTGLKGIKESISREFTRFLESEYKVKIAIEIYPYQNETCG